jgi:hypothetical protein
VWPWLVQMGQGRAGFYSQDGLERLVGGDIRNVDEIGPEWQQLTVGDLVRNLPVAAAVRAARLDRRDRRGGASARRPRKTR